MIKAEHSSFARIIFNPYINHLLKSNFHSFYLLNDLPQVDKSAGLIITPNHFSWWDGFFIDYISQKLLNRKMFLMMLEDQLRKYWFFKKVGAYSINQNNPRSIAETINYTKQVLSSGNNFVVIYPQGEIQSVFENNIIIKDGLKKIIEIKDRELFVLPVSIKIEYGNQSKPEIIVRFGKLLNADAIRDDFNLFKDEFLSNLEILKNTYNFNGFRNLFE